jgi:hypothetical protein
VWWKDIVVVSSHQAGMIGTRIEATEGGGALKAEQAWLLNSVLART